MFWMSKNRKGTISPTLTDVACSVELIFRFRFSFCIIIILVILTFIHIDFIDKVFISIFLFQAVPHSNLFDHMAFEHNFSVGKPDNLVYINDLLNLLEEKLEKMVRNKVRLSILFTRILHILIKV